MKRFALLMLFLMCCCTQQARAQGCAVCTKNAQSLDSKSASGLNKGIVYLALLPLGIIGTIGFAWYRRQRK